MKISKNKKSRLKTISLVAIPTVILIIAGLTYWQLGTSTDDTSSPEEIIASPQKNEPDSQQESDEKDLLNNQHSQSTSNSSGITDTLGSDTDNSQDSVKSPSGQIALQTPTEGQVLNDGLTVSGTSELNLVNYRIKDTTSGVIAQGEIQVKDGLFSGVLNINSTASSGTFEVFSLDQLGREQDHITVNVTF